MIIGWWIIKCREIFLRDYVVLVFLFKLLPSWYDTSQPYLLSKITTKQTNQTNQQNLSVKCSFVFKTYYNLNLRPILPTTTFKGVINHEFSHQPKTRDVSACACIVGKSESVWQGLKI